MKMEITGSRHSTFFPSVVGFTDGILTALTLASGSILHSRIPLGLPVAVKISAAAALSGAFVLFAGEYARLRFSLVRSERQLNLTARGQLAATQLGRAVLVESLVTAGIASVCTFAGALFPLLAAIVHSAGAWVAIPAALLALAMLGAALARAVSGNSVLWILALVSAGGLVTLAGERLKIL